MKLSNLPGKEFKAMVIKMLTELRKWMNEPHKDINKGLENIRKCS